jgi:radical SAM protein with 4Fe4S-binding SPASM domain
MKDFFIQWHLTERCNLRCTHCYQTGEHEAELGLSGIREAASEVSDMIKSWAEEYDLAFSPSFNVTGGEPLLRSDLFEILHVFKEQRFEVCLLTNGTLIRREEAKRLAGLVDGVQISIEGPERIHDTIRGRNTFREAIKGVESLLAQSIAVQLHVTLSAFNVDHLQDLFSLGLTLGVQRVGFSRLVPLGAGAALIGQMLPPGRVREAYATLKELTDARTKTGTGDPIASSLEKDDGRDYGDVPFSGCAAGVSGLTLLADGTITPCRRLPIPIGNIAGDSIRQVWAESTVLDMLRSRSAYTGKCGGCNRWAACRGCRAVAWAYARSRGREDFLGDDPQCFLS